jgi:hypothetical protein
VSKDSGRIRGRPWLPSKARLYTFTAFNDAGKVVVRLNISVVLEWQIVEQKKKEIAALESQEKSDAQKKYVHDWKGPNCNDCFGAAGPCKQKVTGGMPALCAPYWGGVGTCHSLFDNCIPNAKDIYDRTHHYRAKEKAKLKKDEANFRKLCKCTGASITNPRTHSKSGGHCKKWGARDIMPWCFATEECPGAKESKMRQHGKPLFWHYCGDNPADDARRAAMRKEAAQFMTDQEIRRQDVAEEKNSCSRCLGLHGPCQMTIGVGSHICSPFITDSRRCPGGFVRCKRQKKRPPETRSEMANLLGAPTPVPTYAPGCKCSGQTNTLGIGGVCKSLDGQSPWCYVSQQCGAAKRSSRETLDGKALFWLHCDRTEAKEAAELKAKAKAQYALKKQELKELLAEDKAEGITPSPTKPPTKRVPTVMPTLAPTGNPTYASCECTGEETTDPVTFESSGGGCNLWGSDPNPWCYVKPDCKGAVRSALRSWLNKPLFWKHCVDHSGQVAYEEEEKARVVKQVKAEKQKELAFIHSKRNEACDCSGQDVRAESRESPTTATLSPPRLVVSVSRIRVFVLICLLFAPVLRIHHNPLAPVADCAFRSHIRTHDCSLLVSRLLTSRLTLAHFSSHDCSLLISRLLTSRLTLAHFSSHACSLLVSGCRHLP